MMVFAYALMMKFKSRNSINIRKIVEYPGTDFPAKLPQIHAVTGFELLFYMLGKLKFLKNVSMASKLSLLNTIDVSCKVLETAVKDVEKFLQTVYYSRKVDRVLT